jgi:hypothetical protein
MTTWKELNIAAKENTFIDQLVFGTSRMNTPWISDTAPGWSLAIAPMGLFPGFDLGPDGGI